jgi:hypothetical protein
MLKISKLSKFTVGLAAMFAVSPLSAFAVEDTVDLTRGVDPAISGLKPSSFITGAINILLGGAGVIAFIILLVGGIQWILAGGDKEGTEKARKKITNALIGLAIVFSAYALLFIISALFNINLLNFTLKPLTSY